MSIPPDSSTSADSTNSERSIQTSSTRLPDLYPYNAASVHFSCRRMLSRIRRETHSLHTDVMKPWDADPSYFHSLEWLISIHMWVELTMCPFVPSDTELALIFQLIVTGASVTRSLSIRQSLTHFCSSFFCMYFSVSHHSAHRQYIHRWRECAQRKRSQIEVRLTACCVHTSWISKSKSTQWVRALTQRWLDVWHHHTVTSFFFFHSLCINYEQLCSPYEDNFSKSSSDSLCRPRALVSSLL